MRIPTTLTLMALLALPAAGGAQQGDERLYRPPGNQPEAIIYRDQNYSGPAVAVQRDEVDLGLAWSVNSIRINRGSWQICTGRNFSGRCDTITASSPFITKNYRRIVSMRPVNTGGPYPPTRPEPPIRPEPQQSLRGMGAEFFPAPRQNGQRVFACPSGSATANCAARTADNFCRQAGWNGSKSEALQTESRRVYLADVLCTTSGF
ncbi:beta/gamma crystallin-related protein [Sphingobium boeckii]|uniref:Beta/gamma crystallin 'Greek key' domain-containing protein n=1 Tax=Sphingobium boeckii TaxID=1082345 RepID=A0A7W9EFV3_9SPHN|nr:beta/gamma crystallin-related protein [Sphingobium boeckii]MBB5687647.1 hypothetical protein [Sphingobium boeckii]